jgi:hypothetical protein
MLTVVPDPAGRDSAGRSSVIDEIVREGARRMLAEALQAEVEEYITSSPASGMRAVAGWWSVTALTRAGRC